MKDKGLVTQSEFEKHLKTDWRTAHNIWRKIQNYVPGWGYSKAEIDAFFEGESAGKKQVDWARITSKPSSFPPSAHASTHLSGGSDSIKLDDLAAPDDNTDLNASLSKHGLMQKYPGGTTTYLRADGSWSAATPAAHATSHEDGGSDEVNHDDLAGFVAAEHLPLPNTISNVLSDHTKAIHDALNIDADTWDGAQFADYLDQAVKQASSPKFAQATLERAAGSDLVALRIQKAGAPASDKIQWDLVTLANNKDIKLRGYNGTSYYTAFDLLWDTRLLLLGADWYLGIQNNRDIYFYGDAGQTYGSTIGQVGHNLTINNMDPSVDTNIYIKARDGGIERIVLKYEGGENYTRIYDPRDAGGNALALTTRKLDDFGTPDDNTDLNATTSYHGLLPKLGGGTTNYLRADGTWAAPSLGLHASSHELGGADEVDHDQLLGFVAAEHVSLPNTIANVLSNHTKAIHDSLGLSHDSLADVSENDHHNRYHVLAGSDHSASGLTIGHVIRATGASSFAWQQLLWGDIGSKPSVFPPEDHASEHEIGGGDLVDHDSLTGFVANEHINWTNATQNFKTSGLAEIIRATGSDLTYLRLMPTGGPGTSLIQWDFQMLANNKDLRLRGYDGTSYYTAFDLLWNTRLLDLGPDWNIQLHNNREIIFDGTSSYGASMGQVGSNFDINVMHPTADTNFYIKCRDGGIERIVFKFLGSENYTRIWDPRDANGNPLALTSRKLDDFGTPDDNTDLNATTGHHGLLPKLSGVATQFLNGNGGWTVPGVAAHASSHHSGGGDPLAFASIAGFGTYLDQAVKIASSPQFASVKFGATTPYLQANGVYLLLETTYGSTYWGMGNSSWTHFYTDATTGFYFSKRVDAVDRIGVYGQNVYLNATGLYLGSYYLSAAGLVGNNKVLDSDKLDGQHGSYYMPVGGGIFTGYAYAADHGAAATDMLVNVCYGTGSPPTASSTTIGTLFIKYQA